MSFPFDHPLLLAARAGRIDHLFELLVQEDEKDQEKLAAIGKEAAQYEETGILDALIDLGWTVDLAGTNQIFSLPDALRQNKAKLAMWLLDGGADPNIGGSTQSRADIRQEISPLTIAAKYCSLSTMEELINHGARIGESEALSAAATSHLPDRVDKLAFLIRKGADVNEMQLVLPEHTSTRYRSTRGTALHVASKWGFEDSEAFLLEHGADTKLKNSQDQSIEDLKKLPSSLVGRGWSAPQVSTATRRCLGEERKRKREAEAQRLQD